MVAAMIDLAPTSMVAGGDALARDDDGRVVLVTGALPGERVRVALRDERRDFARGDVVEIIEASPHRRLPPCPFVAAGCGGCHWQHIEPAAQAGMKVEIVLDALRRIGGLTTPPPAQVVAIPGEGYRTTVRVGVVDGRAAYHRARSAHLVAIDRCLVAHPLLAELIADGRFGGADEVVLRASAATGERLVVARPRADGVRVPTDVVVVGKGGARVGAIHEAVGGRTWRVSAASFFQAGPDAAEAVAIAVRGTAGDVRDGSRIVDLYAGVGLLGGLVAMDSGARLVSVEQGRSAAADARVNLADIGAKVVAAEVGRWHASPADLVIADPARTGLGQPGVAALTATGAPTAVVVGCDPASFARDARLLAARGFRLETLTVIDAFPNTAHVEAVGRFSRTSH